MTCAGADIVQVGTKAPDFTLPSTKGKSFSFSLIRCRDRHYILLYIQPGIILSNNAISLHRFVI